MQKMIPKVEKVANFGTEEPFVARLMMGLSGVIDATTFNPEKKSDIKEKIMGILVETLFPAFASLQEIRKMESGQRERLLVDVRKEYISFYNRIWAAYKDRMPEVARNLEYDIGFLFVKKDENFEVKAKVFFESHPEVRIELLEYLRKNRQVWQQAVARFRNDYAEHQSIYEQDVQELLTLKAAEICFKNCWTAIEMILMELITTKLFPFARIEEIPEAERDKSVPRRFRVMHRM